MKIFVSYSSHDRDRVEALVRALEASNLSVFWDTEIPPGTPTYNTYLAERLNEADRAVVVWTAASAASSWVIEEANEAARRGILVPVRLDDAEPPLGFRSVQTLDLRGWSGRTSDVRIGQLVDAVSGRPIRRAPTRALPHAGRRLAIIAVLVGMLGALAVVVWRWNRPDDKGTTSLTSRVTEAQRSNDILAPPPPAPELSPKESGTDRFAEDRRSITVDANGQVNLDGRSLWQSAALVEPSCAGAIIRISWQVVKPWPAKEMRLEMRTEIPQTDQTQALGEGTRGELAVSYCGTLMIRNLRPEPVTLELRFASEIWNR